MISTVCSSHSSVAFIASLAAVIKQTFVCVCLTFVSVMKISCSAYLSVHHCIASVRMNVIVKLVMVLGTGKIQENDHYQIPCSAATLMKCDIIQQNTGNAGFSHQDHIFFHGFSKCLCCAIGSKTNISELSWSMLFFLYSMDVFATVW